MDRNGVVVGAGQQGGLVALRKESVDRNSFAMGLSTKSIRSLSARRAWIEMNQSAK